MLSSLINKSWFWCWMQTISDRLSVLFPSDTGEIETVAMKSTPVGPVAGGIMGCFLLLALGVYCYRHHVHRHAHQYVSTLPDNPHRGSHYYNDEEPDGLDDTTAGWCITSIVSGVGGAGGKTWSSILVCWYFCSFYRESVCVADCLITLWKYSLNFFF